MQIAVINSGSSSLKFKLFDMETREILSSKLVENIGESGSKIKTHRDALESLDVDFSRVGIVGHRVVHGGEYFHKPTLVNDAVIHKIKSLIPLAPLHNPANLEGILVAKEKFPHAKQVAVFDTAFHSDMPIEAFLYALPYELYEDNKIRRYGFHGTSHSYVSNEAAKILKKDIKDLNLITLHLGNGSSACAIQKGVSIDTSMGFTPLEGLVMGTRCGDIDPEIVVYIQNELCLSLEEVDTLLNKQSGLKGICNENDIRKLIISNDEKSKLALKMLTRRVKKYVGSYLALLGSVDAVVFTGGIGENSQYIRDKIMDSEFFKNIKVLVIKTDEELEIANECLMV